MYHLKFIRKHININSSLKTVISFALYGNAEKYVTGLYNNCKVISNKYPSFWVYIYVGNDFDKHILSIFDEFKNVIIIETHKSGHINMSYRFITIDYEDVNIAFSRDADSIINERDMYCIDRFIKSNYKFQIIRDHKDHNVEILGGMWGIKRGLLRFKIQDELDKYFENIHNVKYGDDQQFLTDKIYELVVKDSIVFDEFFDYPNEYKEKIITSTPRTNLNHVGAYIY